MATTAEIRRRSIIHELAENRAVSVSDLSERYGVSEVSIRRDLLHLERTGQLRRIHGGALVASGPGPLPPAGSSPDGGAGAAKARIGSAAAALVQPGDRVIFDSGSTVLEVARHIPRDLREAGNLTAITNSLPVVRELGPYRGIHLILLGGIYQHQYQAVVGPSAVAQVSSLHADKLFLGTDGITFSNGLTNTNVLEAEFDRSAIAAASEIIAVADSSKIGLIGLTTLVPLAGIHKLITDTGASAEFVAQLRALGVEVALV